MELFGELDSAMRCVPTPVLLVAIGLSGFVGHMLPAAEIVPAQATTATTTQTPAAAHSVAPGTTVAPAPVVSSSAPVDSEVVTADGSPQGVDFDFNEVNSVFDSPSSDDSPGLLGKIFLQNRYRYFDEQNNAVGDSWQGFDTLLNLPAFTIGTPTPFDVDVFAGYVNMELKGERFYRPDIKSEAFNIGASIYPSQTAPLRPFLQLGARFIETEYTGSSGVMTGTPWNLAPVHVYRNDTRLILNAGLEYDLFESLAYRLTLFTETQGQFEDSALMNELIMWPTRRIFLRGGFTTDLSGDNAGFLVGGGLAF